MITNMPTTNCNLDKFILFSSFLLVFILCILLMQEENLSLPSIFIDEDGNIAPDFHQAKTNASELADDIRILCLVMTYPENHQTRAYRVYKTWGKRCTYVEFITTKFEFLYLVSTGGLSLFNLLWRQFRR